MNGRPFTGPVYMNEISLGYRLVTPRPMDLLSGDYEAEIVYTLDNGGDIDFHATSYSDTELRFRVLATVKHAFNVKFAARDINISLSPQDGWESWRNGGRIPSKLSKEVPFDISSSTRFSVTMQCDTSMDERCGLKNTQTGGVGGGQGGICLTVQQVVPGGGVCTLPVGCHIRVICVLQHGG